MKVESEPSPAAAPSVIPTEGGDIQKAETSAPKEVVGGGDQAAPSTIATTSGTTEAVRLEAEPLMIITDST